MSNDSPSPSIFSSVGYVSSGAEVVKAGRPAGDTSGLPRSGHGEVKFTSNNGINRIQHGAPVSQPSTGPRPMSATASVTGGVQRSTVINGQHSTEIGESVSRASIGSARSTGSAIDTIRSPSTGMPRAGADIKPTDIIDLPNGYTTTIAAALASGFITKDASGNYYGGGERSHSQEGQGRQVEQQQQQE